MHPGIPSPIKSDQAILARQKGVTNIGIARVPACGKYVTAMSRPMCTTQPAGLPDTSQWALQLKCCRPAARLFALAQTAEKLVRTPCTASRRARGKHALEAYACGCNRRLVPPERPVMPASDPRLSISDSDSGRTERRRRVPD